MQAPRPDLPRLRDLRRHRQHVRLRALRRPAQAQRDRRVVARDGVRSATTSSRWTRRSSSTRARGRRPGTSRASPTRWSTARKCKQRFRADHIPELAVPAQAVGAPGRVPGATCELTEAREFNLMFQTTIGPVPGGGLDGLPAAGDGAGHLPRLQADAPVRAQEAAVRHRPGRQVVPQRDHARQLHLPHARVRADGDGVLRPAGPGAAVVRVLVRGAAGLVHAARHRARAPAPAPARRRGALALLERHQPTSSTCTRSAWSELEGVANRGNFDLTQHAKYSGEKLEWKDPQTGEGYIPHVIEPAAGVGRTMLALLCDAYDTDELGGEQRTVLRLHPAVAPVKVAVLPLLRKDGPPGEGARGLRGAAPADERRVRRGRRRSAGATGARTRSARRTRSRSTTRRSRTAR